LPVAEFHYSGIYYAAQENSSYDTSFIFLDDNREAFWKSAEEFLRKRGNRRRVENLAILDWAGPAAQMKLRRKVPPIHLEDDEASLKRRAFFLGLGNQAEAERLAREMKARAVDFVNDPESWRLIQKLAEYLEKRLELKGDEVDQLLGPASPG
jgi:hypothetical protein